MLLRASSRALRRTSASTERSACAYRKRSDKSASASFQRASPRAAPSTRAMASIRSRPRRMRSSRYTRSTLTPECSRCRVTDATTRRQSAFTCSRSRSASGAPSRASTTSHTIRRRRKGEARKAMSGLRSRTSSASPRFVTCTPKSSSASIRSPRTRAVGDGSGGGGSPTDIVSRASRAGDSADSHCASSGTGNRRSSSSDSLPGSGGAGSTPRTKRSVSSEKKPLPPLSPTWAKSFRPRLPAHTPDTSFVTDARSGASPSSTRTSSRSREFAGDSVVSSSSSRPWAGMRSRIQWIHRSTHASRASRPSSGTSTSSRNRSRTAGWPGARGAYWTQNASTSRADGRLRTRGCGAGEETVIRQTLGGTRSLPGPCLPRNPGGGRRPGCLAAQRGP
ncbi:hypothetical protein COSO111634_18220 [Corallococcus soli]